jgi:N-acetylmuramic acid 6-phosphate (MurNAc-6-P) etherase
MAYTASSLIRIGGGSGQAFWYYTSADTIADANTAGYFNDAAAMLNLNDVIMTVTSTGGTPVITHAYVNANNGSVVDITNGVVVTNTDGD